MDTPIGRLDTLTQAAQAATPGPWQWHDPDEGGIGAPFVAHAYSKVIIADMATHGVVNGRANAAHIALNDPQTTLALIAVVRAADDMEAMLDSRPSHKSEWEVRRNLRAALDAAREAGVVP